MVKTFGETSVKVTAPNGILIRFTFPGPPLSPMHLHSLQLQGGGRQGVRDPGASLTSSYICQHYLKDTTINFSPYYSNVIVLITCKLSPCLLIFNQTSHSY